MPGRARARAGSARSSSAAAPTTSTWRCSGWRSARSWPGRCSTARAEPGRSRAAVRARGGEAVSADPAYALPPRRDPGAGPRRASSTASATWGRTGSPTSGPSSPPSTTCAAAAARRWRSSPRDFRGPDPRYVVAALPRLPFDDGAFRLVLSAYLLFAYPDHLDEAAHERALRELLRVAREEVRVFPLIDTAYVRHPGARRPAPAPRRRRGRQRGAARRLRVPARGGRGAGPATPARRCARRSRP